MECNKEEATRAKEIAERKMKINDFAGAQKIAIKALQMFPHLENISQMLAVCEVHCAASAKKNGMMDLYGILQLESTADDSSIKKQYKKLALLLHPDKNQFAGAEAAFKLIGEAQIILCDRAKRQLYDAKYKFQMKADTTKQPPEWTKNNSHVQRNVNKENSQDMKQQRQPQQPTSFNGSPTFWTKCPACNTRYEYYRTFLYKAFYCPGCSRPFIAIDINVPQTHHANQQSQTRKSATAAGNFTGNVGAAAQVNKQGFDNGVNFASRKSSRKEDDSGDFVNPNKKFKGESSGRHNKESKLSQANGRYIYYPDPEFFDFRKTRDADKFAVNQIWAVYCDGDGMPRFYAQITKIETAKVHFSWLEECPSNVGQLPWPYENLPMACGNFIVGESGCAEDWMIFSHVASCQKGKGVGTYHICPRKGEVWALFKGFNLKQTSNADSDNLYEYEVVQVLSEFAETGFTVIHLVKIEGFISLFKYAEEDPYVIPFSEMLRFSHYIPYYRLNGSEREGVPEGYLELDCASLPSDFKEKFPSVSLHTRGEEHSSRLGANDVNMAQNLPVSNTEVGDMKKGGEVSQNSKHQEPEARQAQVLVNDNDKMNLDETSQEIAPEYGSSSPVVRNQASNPDILQGSEVDQYSNSQENEQHEATQAQELVSDSEKINRGETSQENDTESGSSSPVIMTDEVVIDADFEEGEGNLDLKSQEKGQHEATQAQELGSDEDKMNSGNTSKETATESGSSSPVIMTDEDVSDADLEEDERYIYSKSQENGQYEVTHAQELGSDEDKMHTGDNSKENASESGSSSHDFEAGKKIGYFESGQIWAICGVDEYPRHYGFVKKVEPEHSQVQIARLVACPKKNEEQWFNAGMPFSCGTFVVDQEKIVTLKNHAFSQLMPAEQVDTCNQYAIRPNVGEIWAVYRNWRLGWNYSDLKTCYYYVVEICEQTVHSIKARPLQIVDGYETVFKHESEGNFVITMEIPAEEYIRFSHRIPAFPLTNENGGRLQGYWKLDAASVPNSSQNNKSSVGF